MAQVLSNCFISIGGEEYSGRGTNVAISMSSDAQEIKAFGQSNVLRVPDGIVDWTMAMEFLADEAATGAFFAMVGTEVPVEVRQDAGARSATNPGYVGQAIVTGYDPIGGAAGDLHTVSLSLVAAGPLARLTTAV